MNQTALQTFYQSIKSKLTEEQRKEVDIEYVNALAVERQDFIDFGYRVRELDNIKDVYSGRVFVFKTYPERLYEDYFTQTHKP